jgi:hypothetical protein
MTVPPPSVQFVEIIRRFVEIIRICLLTVVVDAKDLVLVVQFGKLLGQCATRVAVSAEWLFNDETILKGAVRVRLHL